MDRNVEPLPSDEDLSLETWLKGTDYTEARKEQLRHAAEELGVAFPTGRQLDCKCFIKKEHYWDKYKYPRAIKSRSDHAKVATGPAFKAMETRMYRYPAFIKHIPVKDRPQYIYDMLSKWNRWYITDYTSFESSFTPTIMRQLEIKLYDRMLYHFPDLARFIESMLTGTNKCVFKGATIKVNGKRMSGEMCTSLGNGFTNLMLLLFVVHEKGGHCDAVIEGDDGEFGTDVEISSADFQRLGFTVKIEQIKDIFHGSFCGLMLSSELTSMVEPRKVLTRFGVSLSPIALGSSKARLALLKAKALSLLYEHPRCPIVSALAYRFITLTGAVKARFERDYWHSQLAREAVQYESWAMNEYARGISAVTRSEFAELFDVAPQAQLAIEQYFSTMGIHEIDCPEVDALFAPNFVGRHYYEHYVSRIGPALDDVLATEPLGRQDGLARDGVR